jgi:uncharacterized protein
VRSAVAGSVAVYVVVTNIDESVGSPTIIPVRITFDPAKRARTLRERGLDFADAALVFAGVTATEVDGRHDYGETRYITAGWLLGRMVILVWTPRGATRRVISMRHAHADEQARWRKHLGGS